jgi:predicted negative regulator of RcsB-dependent stress response
MKTERRHELQTNALADALGHTVDTVKPYSQIIVGAVLAVVVIVGVVKFLTLRSQSEQVDAWNTYLRATSANTAQSSEDLTRLIQQYPETSAAQWAHLSLADQALSDGIGQLFQDRAEGRDKLRKAQEHYQSVQQQASDPLLLQRATLGLARVYESQVELDKAQQEYKRLLKDWPNGAYTVAAKQRLDDLDQKSTREFYDWFATNEPKSTGSLGEPGSRPSFDLDDPKEDIKLDSLVPPGSDDANKTSSQPEENSTKEPVSTAARDPKPESTPPNDNP